MDHYVHSTHPVCFERPHQLLWHTRRLVSKYCRYRSQYSIAIGAALIVNGGIVTPLAANIETIAKACPSL